MKKIRLVITVFVSALFLATAFTLYSSAISSSHWAIDVADFTMNHGILEGTRATFEPDATISRAQFARALAKIGDGNVSGTADTGFADVPSNNPYGAAIKWCSHRRAEQRRLRTECAGRLCTVSS